MTPDALSRVAQAAYRHMRPWTEQQFHDALSSPGAILEASGSAFALARVVLDEAEILALACAPVAQRTGAASRVLNALHVRLIAHGVSRVFLETVDGNEAAFAFYEKHGYRMDGRRARYYRLSDGATADALLMSRALP